MSEADSQSDASRSAGWPLHRRLARAAGFAVSGVIALALIVVGVIAGRLAYGPVSFDGLNRRIAGAMAERLGPSWSVKVSDAFIERAGAHPSLRVSGVEIRNPAGARVLRAPEASVSVNVWNLLLGRVTLRAIEFSGLDLRLLATRDGTLALSAGSDTDSILATPKGVGSTAKRVPDGFEPVSGPAEGQALSNAPAAIAVAAASLMELLTTSDGVFGVLETAGINGARLVVVDGESRERFMFSDVSMQFQKPTDNLRRIAFGLTGSVRRWNMEGTVVGRQDTERQADFTFKDVSVTDLLLLSGRANREFSTDMALSGSVAMTVTAEGGLKALDITTRGSRSTLNIDDKAMPTVPIDDLQLLTSWDAAASALDIRKLAVLSGGTSVDLKGRLSAGPTGIPWRMDLTGKDWIVGALSETEKPLGIETFNAQISAAPGGGINIDQVALAGQKFGIAVSGSFGTEADRGGLRLGVTGARSSARAVLRLWPQFASPNVREYLIRHLRDGVVENLTVAISMSGTELADASKPGPLPAESIKATYELSDVTLTPSDVLPPLTGGVVKGTASGRAASLAVPEARLSLPDGRSLALSDGAFSIPDTSAPRAPTIVNFRLAGGADALVAALGTEALKGALPLDIEPSAVRGQTDLRINLGLPLVKNLSLSEVVVTANGSFNGLGIDNIVGKEKLEAANLAMNLDPTILTMKGEGKIAGLQSSIDLRQPLRGGAGEVVLTTVMDDAARTRRGLTLGKQLTGPIGLKITVLLGKSDRKGPRIEVDLTRAAIDDLAPGWIKSAGRPGRAVFTLVDRPNGGFTLDDLSVEAGLSAKGSLSIAADGTIDSAALTSLKVSPGDDMRLDLTRLPGGGLRVAAKGPIFDARPFLRAVTSGGDGKDAKDPKESKDLELDLSANILTGFNEEAITAAAIKLSRRGKDIRQLQMSGRFGRAPISAQLVPRDKQPSLIVVETDDAGSLLRFVDLYKRMVGGKLALQVAVADTRQSGNLTINAFVLKNEPALNRIVSQQPTGSTPSNNDRATQAAPNFEASEVNFTKLKAEFTRTATRLDLKEAVIWGPYVGFNIDGNIDFGRDRVNLNGTYVPAYALNNAFSQVPLFGPLLGGGATEGLFAVSFRITGPASAPTLTINPLSAVAPGIFRKLFEAFTPDGSRAVPPGRIER